MSNSLRVFFASDMPLKRSGVFGFFAVRSAQPFVIDGILRIERDGFFGAGDGLDRAAASVVSFSSSRKEFRIFRIFGGGFLQATGLLWIVADFVGLARGFEGLIGSRWSLGQWLTRG